MDIKRENITPQKSIWRWLTTSLVVALISYALSHLWQIKDATINVNKDSLVLATVKRGDFRIDVLGNGVLAPKDLRWLSVASDSKVESLAVKPGKLVGPGDLIMELSNIQLQQDYEQAQWDLEALEAEHRARMVEIDNNITQVETEVLNAKLEYEKSMLEYHAQTALVKTSAISQISYKRTQLSTRQLKERWHHSQWRLQSYTDNRSVQALALLARLNKKKKSVQRLQENIAALTVRAETESIVLELPLALGQRLKAGANLAKLAKHKSLMAELFIPELQITQVKLGQAVVLDTRKHKLQGYVTRIDPAVVEGQVQVDVEITSPISDDARPELSIEGRIRVANLHNVLYVGRPLFSTSQSTGYVFKLSPNQRLATKTKVQMGTGSIANIQIIDGLREGDTIITSDTSSFDTHDKIRVN